MPLGGIWSEPLLAVDWVRFVVDFTLLRREVRQRAGINRAHRSKPRAFILRALIH
jgi:hypothetical protein